MPVLIVSEPRAVGPQRNAFDDPDVVGFAREGKDEIPGSAAPSILLRPDGRWHYLYVGRGSASLSVTCPCASRRPS